MSLHLEEAALRCEKHGIDATKKELEWLLEAATGRTRLEWMLGSADDLSEGWLEKFEFSMARRLKGEPVQYILESGSFFGREFKVGQGVLIPRPETELLVEWAILAAEKQARPRILDIGTGSGCIAITMALEVEHASTTGVDISPVALDVAAINASDLGAKVTFVQADVLKESVPEGPYSMILSNPPYVPLSELESMQLEVRGFEPHLALFAGQDPLLFYRRIATLAPTLLDKGGLLGVEIHADYASEVVRIFEKQRFGAIEVNKDLSGRDRFITAFYS